MTQHPQAEILRAIADGHTEFEIKINSGWVKTNDALLQISSGFEVRIAQPNTITGTLTIPEPMRVRPKDGERYWCFRNGCVATEKWDEDADPDYQETRFLWGIWDTRDKAQQVADAWDDFIHGGVK